VLVNLLTEPVCVEHGHTLIPDRPCRGIAWDEAVIERPMAG
jgi:hypothetical protein